MEVKFQTEHLSLLKKLYPFDTFGSKGNELFVHGLILPFQDFFYLTDLLNDSPCKNVVEIGAWTGRTTCVIADYVKRNGGKFYTIDNFAGWDTSHLEDTIVSVKDILTDNLIRFGVNDCTEILEGNSDEFVSRFTDGFLDLVFIDADHR